MKVVLDTNIIVSGLLSPFGVSGEILRMVSCGTLKLCYDARILDEYQEVLLRPKFSFNQDHISYLLEYIEAEGEVTAGNPLPIKLPDPDDEPFLEAALAGDAEYLITRNLRHYPKQRIKKPIVISPERFLEICRNVKKKKIIL